MKKAVRLILLLLASLLWFGEASAATCTSIRSANWSRSNTWSCGRVPRTTDTVVIASGFTVNLNGNYRVAALTINATGVINDMGNTLTVTGNIVNNGTFGVPGGGGTLDASGAGTTISGAGAFVDSILQIDQSATILTGSSLNFSLGGLIDVGPNAPPPNTVTLNIAGTITGTGQTPGNTILNGNGFSSINVTGSINAPASDITLITGDVLANNATVTIQTLTTDPGTSWTQGANSSLTLGSTAGFQGTLNASATGNTVTYPAGTAPIVPSGNTYFNIYGPTCPQVAGLIILGTGPCGGGPPPQSVTMGPTLCVNDAGIGTQSWSGLNNVAVLDNVYAQASGANGQITNYLKCTGYGFNIPAGATISGITVGPWVNSTFTFTDYAMQLVKGGVIQATNLATGANTFPNGGGAMAPSPTQLIYGGSTNLWGGAWTPADINSANFGAAFAAQRGAFPSTQTAGVDYMPITVYYTAPLAEYRMDEGFWNGTAGEVQDASGNGNNAQAFDNASTDGATPAIPGNPGTCRYGVFDNGGTITQGYVLTPLPNFTTDFTITAWIRTTNNALSGQRILIDDQSNTGGYGFSLGDGGGGRLRFYSRAISPVILDSTYTIANNSWYFVAAVIDITNRRRTIYVFNASGALLNSTSDAAAFTGTWGTDAGPVSIGAETNASSEPPANFHFRGNLDEVRVYQQALNQAAVTAIATQTHPCSVVGPVPNHYELSMPTNSVACVPTTVTVTACTDASSPCTNPFAAASGTTAVLATSGGTLGATPVTFNASGIASTTLSYPTAPDGTPVTVTLSGEQIAASNPRQWCPDGTSCVVANSGATTFKTAGFIFSATAGGGVATIPTQVAGISSATNYLRAVKTNTTTQACEAALSGANAIDFAYECNNPATCYAGNLMSVNGGTATTIARNDNGSVTSYLTVNMTFDANGNAPFTLNYSDVGQVTLWVSKAAGGALLTALTGSSNAFVVKPDHFTIGNIACTTVGAGTCAPANGSGANPAATGPAGGAFIQAGKPFTATVTAMSGAATPAFTPSFGKESPAEGAELSSYNHLPGLGSASAIGRVLSGFNSGAATLTDLAWNEVGVLQLHATLSDANGYLGSDPINGKNSVVSSVDPYVGRFIADHFDTVVTAQSGGFAYSGNPTGPVPGQPFTVTVTAMNGLATPTATANYYNAGGYAKNVNLSVPVGGGTGQLYVDAVAGGTGAVPAAKFLNINPGEGKVNYSDATGKISFVFGTLPHAPQTIQIHAEDADTVTSSGANGSINILQGRLRLFNAFGSEKAALSLPLRAEYWSGNSWILNSADSVTQVPAASVALSGYSGTLSATNLGSSHVSGATLSSGQGSIVLAMPSPTATGSVDLAINLGSGPTDQSCLGVYPSTTGAGLAWLRSIYGSCAVTYDRDPSARASFGVYAPETKQTIHVRELY